MSINSATADQTSLNGPSHPVKDRLAVISHKTAEASKIYAKKFESIDRRLDMAEQIILDQKITSNEMIQLRGQELYQMSTMVDQFLAEEKQKQEEQDSMIERMIE